MKIAQLLILSIATLLFTADISAQKSLKAIQEADMLYETGNYLAAAEKYISAETSVKEIDEKGRLIHNIADCYRLAKNPSEAIKWYDKANTAQYWKVDPEMLYNYGKSYQEDGKFEEAIAQFNKYIEKGGNKGKADLAIKSANDAADAALGQGKLKTRYIVENEGAFNSQFFDYSPMWSSKKQDELIFTSGRQAATGSGSDQILGDSFMDIFVATKDKKGKWSTPVLITSTVNTEANEGAACYDKDCSVLYFTRCDYSNDGRFGCDIWTAKKQGDSYAEPTNLNVVDRSNGDDSTRIGQPSLTPDEKVMYFASNMAGGKGGRDIWYSTFDKKSETWGKPVNLSTINTSGDEMFPYIHPNGTLYFSSNGLNGIGGLDIFKAEKTGDNTYGTPANMGFPINSSADDFGIIFEKDQNAGYFSSNRTGGKGKDDIYSFREPPIEICFQGVVYDKVTGATLPNTSVTISVAPEGKQYPITTDGNGGFSLCKNELKSKDILSLNLSREKYIAASDKVDIGERKESGTIAREYFLEPIIEKKEYTMPLVLYPYDQDILLVDNQVNSADSLMFLFNLMNDNPNLIIQLEAHTDDRGDNKYNQDLSQRRANTCVNFLISKGIDPARLKPVGKGESEPRTLTAAVGNLKVGTQLTEKFIGTLSAEEKEIAWQLNRRTIFKIIGQDFKPKTGK